MTLMFETVKEWERLGSEIITVFLFTYYLILDLILADRDKFVIRIYLNMAKS